jgi:hypothetical protein
MTKCFFTYFDLLGYRNFLKNNPSETHEKVIHQFFVHIDSALNLRKKYKKANDGSYLNDLSGNRIHFANYSETVLMWTDGATKEEFTELLEISYECNWRMNLYHFPIRGALVYDELKTLQFNSTESNYHVNTFFGKGLINAHDLSENQQWAGMILDNSVFQVVNDLEKINEKCIKYSVPFKSGVIKMYAMKLVINLRSDLCLKNTRRDIEENFKRFDKWDDNDESLKAKLNNTFKFIEFLKE